ncbi:MAG: HU family DNA-binding protein [Clostridiales bacterium]|nr:HU family DNA-binding protein [Clostridiales bacterium]
MNKNALIAEVAKRSHISKKQSKEIVECVFDCMADELNAGNNVQIVGFGNFKVKERSPREGISLETNDRITFPSCRVVSFRIGKTLRDRLNGLKSSEAEDEE